MIKLPLVFKLNFKNLKNFKNSDKWMKGRKDVTRKLSY